MNKKGFTLIELLSTLVILGIITTIAVQTYFVLVKNNDESKYTYYEELVRNGADLYFESQKYYLSSGECLTVTYQTLLDGNYIKEEDVTCDPNGVIQLKMVGKKATYNLDNLSCTSGRFVKEASSVPSCN